MKVIKYKILIIFLLVTGGCFQSNYVYVEKTSTNQELGGKYVKTETSKKALSFTQNSISGMPSKMDQSVTAALLINSKGGKQIFYSNKNTIETGREIVVTVDDDAKRKRLSISRTFFKEAPLPLFTDPKFSDVALLTKSSSSGSLMGEGFAGEQMVDKEPVDILIIVKNTGDVPIKKPFFVFDTVPDIFNLQSVKYLDKGGIDKVTHTKKRAGDKVNIAFKLYPDPESGMWAGGEVSIKLTVLADLAKITKKQPE